MLFTSKTLRICSLLFSASMLISVERAGAQTGCPDSYKVCTAFADNPITSTEKLEEYYSAATMSGLSGEAFKNELNKIIRGHKRYTYKCVWTALAEIDKDENTTDSVVGFYSKRSIPRLNRDCGRRNQEDNWNREHVWAKSHGFPNEGQHAYTDLHHLVATDKSVNGKRDSRDFKAGGTNDRYLQGGPTDEIDCDGCKEIGSNSKDTVYSFEPPDHVKGQIARIMFYMDTRYDGTDSNTPDLILVDEKTFGNTSKFGYMSELLKWHCRYAVSERERRRNDIIEKWQENRNPFVDRPDFVEKIWAEEYPEIFKNCNIVSPPTGIVPPTVITPPTAPSPEIVPPIGSVPAHVWINEFHYDNSGKDRDEFVEIGCNSAVDVAGFKIVLYNGKGGKMYDETKLLGKCTLEKFVFKYFPKGIQNGRADGIALIDASGAVLEFLSYEGTFEAEDGPARGMISNDVGASESNSTGEDESLQLTGEGCEKKDFVWTLQAPRSEGTTNRGQKILEQCNVLEVDGEVTAVDSEF